MSLKKNLDERKCFKLICGAGNENLAEVEKLVALYSAVGCHFFDVAADEEVLEAAQKGLDYSLSKEEQKDYHLCISVGTKGDQHVKKAKINSEKCVKCGVCMGVCPQNAIKCRLGSPTQQFEVVENYCIGCFRCKAECKFSAIDGYSRVKNFENLLNYNLSCIELHAADSDDRIVTELWDNLCSNFDGMLSLCIGRTKLSNERVISRIKNFVSKRQPYSIIIQTDGSPMSGGKDDYNTTLQAVAMADLVDKLNLPVYILPSGGTNSKTLELAEHCGVSVNGVAIGSYARKIVKEYIEKDDFLTNKAIFAEACKIAKNVVNI